MRMNELSDPVAPGPKRDSYRGVMLILCAAAFAAALALAFGGMLLDNSVLLHAAVSLGLSTGVLAGVVRSQMARTDARDGSAASAASHEVDETEATPPIGSNASADDAAPLVARGEPSRLRRLLALPARLKALRPIHRRPAASRFDTFRVVLVGLAAFGTMLIVVTSAAPAEVPTTWIAGLGVLACLGAAGMAATAVHYLAQIDPSDMPESTALARGARVVMWLFVLAAAAVAAQWLGWSNSAAIPAGLGVGIASLNAALCYDLFTTSGESQSRVAAFDGDFAVTRLLGSRTNPLASLMDSTQAQLGIDLRSTWALAVVRHSLEPLVVGLALVGWLTTSLTVIGVDEQGLVERFGVPVLGAPLEPGLHLHLPWPADRVFRIPVQRVQSLSVGHEGQEEGGPENVLWAVEHAPNEYTLLLGNGRDLITIDATVQFRIRDARAWQYASQNPIDGLRAIAYRAVMRTTVNHTLAEALSENVVAMAARMRTMVQEDADALGIGVEVLDFTIGGMHPPVAVASDYQAVVSAELGKVTAVVDAQATRNRTVPYAESGVLVGANTARAEGADALAKAAGEAWSFRTLEAQYRASPVEYFFRQRLEALERALPAKRITVLDARIQRDRGELWITP
jgi:regulator of protease activity HflC (stomatin/prohibitin superfamily)